MIVRIEDLRDGCVETILHAENPMWVKFEFADFTLRVSEQRGIAVIGSTDASIAIYPRGDNQIEIARRQKERKGNEAI